jgi:hypothetical protein
MLGASRTMVSTVPRNGFGVFIPLLAGKVIGKSLATSRGTLAALVGTTKYTFTSLSTVMY